MDRLHREERIDYITQQLHIIQSKQVFSFSIDAVLLARFTYVPITRGSIIDLCSGNGVIPLVLSTRSSVPITGIEIQPTLVDMANRSVHLNQLEHQIRIIQADVREKSLKNMTGQADLVTCNPPYFATPGEKEWNENPYLAAARHERNGTLEEIVEAASYLVKPRGKVAMVLRPERMMELLELFRRYRIEPKQMKLIYPKEGKDANILLLEGTKNGKPRLRCLPPLTVYDSNGNYTEEFQKYYDGK